MHNHKPHLSFWQFPSVDKRWDFCIVGGGITGALSAWFLKIKHPNATIAILDKHGQPQGATTRNAGFACFGSISEYLDDADKHGKQYAGELMMQRYEGLQILQDIFKVRNIQWEQNGGLEIFTPQEVSLFQECADHLFEVNQWFGLSLQPFKVKNEVVCEFNLSRGTQVIYNQIEGAIHSGLMLQQLYGMLHQKGVEFYRDIAVTAVQNIGDKVELDTDRGTIITQECVIAVNGLAQQLLPELDVYPNRGQILVTSPLPNHYRPGNFHYQQGYYYLRHLPDMRVLIGGGRHLDKENEQTDSMETTERIQNDLERVLKEVFLPDADYQIDFRWAGTMAFGSKNEKTPLVGRKGNIHYIVRLGGMGVALAPYITSKYFS
ncbi:MAG: FAD-binding oxidoreductase [Cryomorphaceae bacterium]|nr:FAD-binding oxidoreductase [Cryomorphaceae bacterium]